MKRVKQKSWWGKRKQSKSVKALIIAQPELIIECDCEKWRKEIGITLDQQDMRESGYSKCPFCKKPFKAVSS